MNNVPQHVSIIMDGNGRWAKARGKERVYGHMAGVESVRACTEAAVEAGVKYLSLYAFSEENWNRPEAEVNRLMELMMEAIHNEVKTLLDNGVRFVRKCLRTSLSEHSVGRFTDDIPLYAIGSVVGDYMNQNS